MVKKRGRKQEVKLDIKWIIIPLALIFLLSLAVYFLLPYLNQSGKVVSTDPSSKIDSSMILSSEVKTVSRGDAVSINGASLVLTNLISNYSATTPSFATFIFGSESDFNANGLYSRLTIDSKPYTLTLVSFNDKNASVTISGGATTSNAQINKSKYLQFNFGSPSLLHIGDYFLIGNGTVDYLYQVQNAGVFIDPNCDYQHQNCAMAQFLVKSPDYNVSSIINVSWSGWVNGSGTLNIYGGYIVPNQYYLVLVQGLYPMPASVYNVSVQQFLDSSDTIGRYVFNPSHNIIYSQSYLPSVYLKDTSSASGVSAILGSEVFLNSDKNRKTVMNLGGKDYTIELLSINQTSATFNVSSMVAPPPATITPPCLSCVVKPTPNPISPTPPKPPVISAPTCSAFGASCPGRIPCCSASGLSCKYTWTILWWNSGVKQCLR